MNLQHLLIVTTILLVSVNNLKLSQIGKNEWYFQNIGEIREASIKYDKIFFLSEKNLYGILSKQNGNILYRNEIKENDRIVNDKFQTELEILFWNNQNDIEIYNFEKNKRKSILNFKSVQNNLLSSDINKVLEINGNYVVLTNTEFGYVSKSLFTLIKKENYLTMQNNQHNIITIYSKDNQICVNVYSHDFVEVHNHCINQNIPSKFMSVGDQILLIYEDYLQILQSDNHSFRKIQGELITTLNKQNSIILKHNEKTYLYNIKQNLKTNVDEKFYAQTNSGKLVEIQTEREQHKTIFKLNLKNFNQISWVVESQKNIKKIWINQRTDIDLDILIQYDDLLLEFYSVGSHNRDTLPKWQRQESLAYITDALFINYQIQQEFENQYFHELLQNRNQSHLLNFPAMFTKRIMFEVKDLIHGIKQTFDDILDIVTKINLKNLFDLKNPVIRYQANSNYEITYGLRKQFLVITSKNTLMSIDSKKHNILWKKTLECNNCQNLELVLMVIEQVQRIFLVQYYDLESKIRILEINQLNGNLKKIKEIQAKERPKIFQPNLNVIGFKFNQEVKYFEIQTNEEHTPRDYIFYKREENKIFGQINQNGSLKKLWNIYIPQEQTIILIKTSFKNDKQSRLPLFDDKSVFYKNIDFTNFAVVTRSGQDTLNLYIINAKNGHILFNKVKKNVDFNNYINLEYDENTVFISYYNKLNRIFEVWVVEQYHYQIDTSAAKMIVDYMQNKQTTASNKFRSNIIFAEQIYGVPLSLKVMKVSSSKLGLLKRNILIITNQNQLYSIERQLLNARRSSDDTTFQSDRIPKYEYLIPIFPINFLNYNVLLSNLNNIQFNPTSLESTLFIVTYGTDIFFMRSAPEKTFDMITQDFNYLFLIIVVVAVTLGFNWIKNKTIQAKVRRHFD